MKEKSGLEGGKLGDGLSEYHLISKLPTLAICRSSGRRVRKR